MNLDALLNELTQGTIDRPVLPVNLRAARVIVQLAQQAAADREFRLKHQDMVVVEPTWEECRQAYATALEKDNA